MGRSTSIESIKIDAERNHLDKRHCHSVPLRPKQIFLQSMA